MKLIDTDGKGIDRIWRNGVVAGGQEYELDVIVWASGFVSPAVGTPASKAAIYLTGKGGQRLEDKFRKYGVSTLHGVISRGFPNLFWPGPPQAGGMLIFACSCSWMCANQRQQPVQTRCSCWRHSVLMSLIL